MSVWEVDLDLLVERFDLAAYVQQHAGERAGRHEVLLDCPRCGKQKLSVHVVKKRWRCFRCEKYQADAYGFKRALEGAGGVVSLIAWLERISIPEAIKRCAEFTAQALGSPHELPPANFAGLPPIPEALCPAGIPERCWAVVGSHPYLDRRCISVAEARQWGLGVCGPDAGWLANRLVFPVWRAGVCLYWQARAMWDEHEHVPRPFTRRDGTVDPDRYRKSLNPARYRVLVDGTELFFFGSGDVVLNLEQASRYPRIAICEGPTSAIRAGPDAVATFGKQLQPNQVAQLLEAGVRAIDFMWDGPSAKEPEGAWASMISAAQRIAPLFDVRLVFLPQGDPGDYTREELAYFRAHARSLLSSTTYL